MSPMIWSILFYAMLFVYLICCVILTVVVLAQEGKGGGLSGLISGGSALGDTFGAQGGDRFFRTWTRNVAILFISLSIGLTLTGEKVFRGGGRSVLDSVEDLPKTAPVIGDLKDQLPVLEGTNQPDESGKTDAGQPGLDLFDLDSQKGDAPAQIPPAGSDQPAPSAPEDKAANPVAPVQQDSGVTAPEANIQQEVKPESGAAGSENTNPPAPDAGASAPETSAPAN